MGDISVINVGGVNHNIKDAIARELLSKTNASEQSHVLTVGQNGCNFTTINDAIEYAKDYCTQVNRVSILVAAGTYYENIVLVPNPGIDIIGLGTVALRSSTPYPYSPIYTTGAGYFENLYCVNSANDGYGLHVEHSSGYDEGDLTFVNCTFVGSGSSSGAGIGMSGGLNLIMHNCYMIGYNGLYMHNRALENAKSQFATFNGCRFESSSGKPIWLDDAAQMAGLSISQLLITFANCFSTKNSITIRYSNTKVLTYFDASENNILLNNNSSGNSILALNHGYNNVITFTCPVNHSKQLYYTLPYSIDDVTITNIAVYVLSAGGYRSGEIALAQGYVVAITVPDASANEIVEVTIRLTPK